MVFVLDFTVQFAKKSPQIELQAFNYFNELL